MATDPQQITNTLVELADTLVSDYDLAEYLDRLLERSVDVLGANAGGVMLFDRERGSGGGLQLLACTDERTRELELHELQVNQGPCIDSHRLGQPIVAGDLLDAHRWPAFAPVAIDYGYRAVYAFPLRLRSSVIGALNLFRTAPGLVLQEDVRVAQAFADMATIGILQKRAVSEARELAGQLQSALNSRVIIEQAKGIVAESLGCDMDRAYQLIRWFGRNSNRQVRSVAAAIVAGELSPAKLQAAGPPR